MELMGLDIVPLVTVIMQELIVILLVIVATVFVLMDPTVLGTVLHVILIIMVIIVNIIAIVPKEYAIAREFVTVTLDLVVRNVI